MTGGVWTSLAISRLPGNPSPLCVRCGVADESLLHRLWTCTTNKPFLDKLNEEISSPSVLVDLPSCACRCGLFPRGCQLDVGDVVALQSYLAGVNSYATDCVVAAREGNQLPDALPYCPRKLPTSAVYGVQLSFEKEKGERWSERSIDR